jgi:predicted RNA polymerase sigma factor
MSESATHDAIEAVARDSYGRLVAYIASRTGDIADAQDALSEALVVALENWPTKGVPDKPEAWLLHVARNRWIDASRREQTRRNAEPLLLQLAEQAEATTTAHDSFPDERLKLLFVCAHPAIDVAAAMSQRLVRAKTKIRDAGIPCRVPGLPELTERLSFVLDAIYAAYTTGWDCLPDAASMHRALASEAIVLGRVLVQLMPAEPEALGLLALMLARPGITNWRPQSNPFTRLAPNPGTLTGRKSHCFMKALSGSRPTSAHRWDVRWRWRKQAILPPG